VKVLELIAAGEAQRPPMGCGSPVHIILGKANDQFVVGFRYRFELPRHHENCYGSIGRKRSRSVHRGRNCHDELAVWIAAHLAPGAIGAGAATRKHDLDKRRHQEGGTIANEQVFKGLAAPATSLRP
jgi:hypothetical protein